MEWQQISNILIILFITVSLGLCFSYIGTGKKIQDTKDIDKELWFIFGFTLLVVIALYFTNHLLIGSDPKAKLNLYMGMIYASIFMAYVSVGIINYKS